MSKTTVLYISMVAVFVVGLWATIRLGSVLQAPHDISGKWTVAATAEGKADAAPKSFAISQSGRFVKLTLDGKKAIDLHLVTEDRTTPGIPQTFEGDGQTLAVRAANETYTPARDAVYHFQFRGPVEGTWAAQRDEPSDVSKAASSKH